MARAVIVMPEHPNLEPEVVTIGRELLPAGFTLDIVPRYGLPEALRSANYLLGFVGRLSDETLLDARRLRLIQLLSAGYDTVNLSGCRAAGIPVALNGGANAIGVAEHAITLILATLKHLAELNEAVHRGDWRGSQPRLYELAGSTVGIVGMGQIGRHVAERLAGWGADLVYADPVRLAPERERELRLTYLPLEELLARSDVVTLHCPLSDATRHLIDRRTLKLLKPTAVLVNTSRGEVMDEVALAEALRERRLLGAGLDVFQQEPPRRDHPLFGLRNVILTPHVAGPTWQSWPRRFANGYANIERVQRGEPALWVVPELADVGQRTDE